MILLSSVSGLVIWWKRRPQGGLGVPPLRHDLADSPTTLYAGLGHTQRFPDYWELFSQARARPVR